MRNIAYALFGLMLCAAGISSSVTAAPSNLDPTFGALGKVVSSPDGTPTFTSSGMALQPDGKIVIVGNRVQSGQYTGMIVARYNADGSLDTTFANSGWSSVTFGPNFELAAAVAIQADGKIAIGGRVLTNATNPPDYAFGIARFNSDGSLDTTFDGVWYLLRSTQGFAAFHFGVSTDVPTPNAFVP